MSKLKRTFSSKNVDSAILQMVSDMWSNVSELEQPEEMFRIKTQEGLEGKTKTELVTFKWGLKGSCMRKRIEVDGY